MQPKLLPERVVNGLCFVERNGQPLISGIEICRRLGYTEPRIQAFKLFDRHKTILEPHSNVTNLVTVDGKKREVRAYDEPGARFFIAKCDMPLADELTMQLIKAFIQLRDERLAGQQQRLLTGLPKSAQRIIKQAVREHVVTATGKQPPDDRMMSVIFEALQRRMQVRSYRHLSEDRVSEALAFIRNFQLQAELFPFRPPQLPVHQIAKALAVLVTHAHILTPKLKDAIQDQVLSLASQFDTSNPEHLRLVVPALCKAIFNGGSDVSTETVH